MLLWEIESLDGKTEEEFIEDYLRLDEQLAELNVSARDLAKLIHKNVQAVTGE